MLENEGRRATWDPDHMMLNAKSLKCVASGLDEKLPEARNADPVLFRGMFLAAPILWTLATEIALKAFQCRERESEPDHIHDLLALYEALDPLSQTLLANVMSGEERQIRCLISEIWMPGDTALRAILRYHRFTFERWRYYYENQEDVFYNFLGQALTEIINIYDETRSDPA